MVWLCELCYAMFQNYKIDREVKASKK